MKKIFAVITICLLIVSCGGDVPKSDVKQWKDYDFHVESRPPIVEVGMNELLFLGNYKKRGRADSLIVYYRMGEDGKWVQAMQDGLTGVYRRAMMVKDPTSDVLHVHVREKGEEIKDKGEIFFTFSMNFAKNSPPEN